MKRQGYLSWESFFVSVAKVCAMRSKDPSTQVGAVIVNPLKQIIATGYNGFPRGIDDNEFPWTKSQEVEWKNTKYPFVVHAELNAIVNARADLSDCSLYITLFPCNECAKIIIQAGIKEVFYTGDKNIDSKEAQASIRMLKAANITTKKINDIIVEVTK
ncbi:deoxycytidylate deaminase [Mesoplasma corruscae]|uniref:Deoxycytidylate deaminase n=1 Tax=Mesoplasma corruscae TaxID=216874 RepID=A0A2S5RG14_9MOLU|nr:dCMP deaminase family protein [Mesoplasma corruscae]PPE06274.1 deoxycytidylate deaminase [Mesoplasma corruscae]